MYNNFPTIKTPEKNLLQSIVEKYNTTLNEIESDKNPSVDRALVDNFFDIKKQVSDIYNSMRNNSPPLMTPGNTITPYIPPQALAAARNTVGPIFLSDMYNGYNGPNDKSLRTLTGNDYAVRNEIEPNPLAQQQQFQRMQQRNNPNVNAPMFAKRCINSSFSNALNQEQFRSDADVVMMQADNGSIVPINNANVYDRSGMPKCNQRAYDFANFQNEEYTQANMPVLKSVTKQQYQQNLAQEMARQNQARDVSFYNPLNNPANPIWKPVSSKYVD